MKWGNSDCEYRVNMQNKKMATLFNIAILFKKSMLSGFAL